MGACGFITIWKDEKVREQWPDCDELFSCLPTHYKHELDGKFYHHLYEGSNLMYSWAFFDDWYFFKEINVDRLRKFVEWLERNYDAGWEVWT